MNDRAMTLVDGTAKHPTNGSTSHEIEPARSDESREPTLEETLEELAELAHRKAGRIPADLLARHVVGVTGEGDWALRRAAMEAILRRCRFGERDGLVIVRSPAGSVTGSYATARAKEPGGSPRRRRKPGEPRPYSTWLSRVAPLVGGCDC